MLNPRPFKSLYCFLIFGTVGTTLAFTSVTQAQLNDGVPSTGPFTAGIFNFPGDPEPSTSPPFGGTSATDVAQVNIGVNADIGNNRTFEFAEVNITDNAALSVRTRFIDSEVNLISGSLAGQENFEAGTTLNQSGGSIGNNTNISGVANISNGTIGGNADLFDGGTINLSGGSFGSGLEVFAGGTLNVSGGDTGASGRINGVLNVADGLVGANTRVNAGGEANFSGGSVGGLFTNAGAITVSGGDFNNTGTLGFHNVFVDADATSATFEESFFGDTNFIGTEFFLDGVPVGTAGVEDIITVRNQTLTGTLLDGSQISFLLNDSNPGFFDDFFPVNSTLSVTVAVPEPTSLAVLMSMSGLLLARRRRS